MNLTASTKKLHESAGDKMLAMIRVKYPEYHPVMAIADIAHTTEDEKTELACHQSIAKYVIPELKSLQIDAKVEQHRRVTVELFDMMSKPDLPKEHEAIEADMQTGNLFGDDMVTDVIARETSRLVLEGDDE